MGARKKLSLGGLLRKSSRGAKALPASTTKKKGGLFGGKSKKTTDPTGIDVGVGNSQAQADAVSAITPVTGLPPDSPGRVSLPPLLPPAPAAVKSNALLPRNVINVPPSGLDEVSVLTGVNSPMGTPVKNTRNQPQQDVSGDEITVYEDISTSAFGRSESPISHLLQSGRPNDQTRKKRSKISALVKSKVSRFTRSKYFGKLVDKSFASVDVDKSGDVTLEELYAGLLLIHLNMAKYVGSPACRPASKEYVSEIFELLDTDNSGTLSKDEFRTVMKILYSQVLSRILIHWTIVLLVVPVVSQHIVRHTTALAWMAHEAYKDIDDDLDPLQRLLWSLWLLFLSHTPAWMDKVGSTVYGGLCKVPFRSMALTALTVVQTSLALPVALNKVEDLARYAARSQNTKEQRQKFD